ncbi:helix-turn-helix domain-containing protein [Bacillus sp. V5-8f]|uniref:helix-turn-helix domain-containing protein n=1 Tax=Bacillus sp. V5-8f TaxID=2053044 RepID=UPI0015E089B4|nr:helix-turn-helix domain-containing protein [Bacillus sp. V5-8f]
MLKSTFLESILLRCLNQFNGERSIFAIYHLLKGKKSSQTIQDSHLFGLRTLFAAYPMIDRGYLHSTLGVFCKNGWALPLERNHHYRLTDKGKGVLDSYMKNQPFPSSLDGWKFHDLQSIFWGRLSLLVQSLSHIIHEQNRFYPIQREAGIQGWVKQFLNQCPFSRDDIGHSLYEELANLLERRTEMERYIFVMRLSGAHRIGSTYSQISESIKSDEVYVRFVFLGTVHFILNEIRNKQELFPILFSVIKEFPESSDKPLTESTKLTLRMLEEGMGLDEIAVLRGLKAATIEDHIVEIALAMPGFSISPFVSAEDVQKIREAVHKVNTKQLKVIKSELGDFPVSFFQIRLVLTRGGVLS